MESWGSEGKNEKIHQVHQAPLTKHHGPIPSHHVAPTGDIFKDLHNLIMGKVKSITKTGPAMEHHKGKILPTHNILKPGAHPA